MTSDADKLKTMIDLQTKRNHTLVLEIKRTYSSLMNQIVCRRDHPSYGYTKSKIRETLAHLEGLLHAWMITTKDFNSALTNKAYERGYQLIFDNANINDLRKMVNDS